VYIVSRRIYKIKKLFILRAP